MTKYCLYILYSVRIDKYYIGTSANPEKRLLYHNKQPKGWTQRGRPWMLVFQKEFASPEEAQKWEKQLKAIKKRSIIAKILNGEFIWQ